MKKEKKNIFFLKQIIKRYKTFPIKKFPNPPYKSITQKFLSKINTTIQILLQRLLWCFYNQTLKTPQTRLVFNISPWNWFQKIRHLCWLRCRAICLLLETLKLFLLFQYWPEVKTLHEASEPSPITRALLTNSKFLFFFESEINRCVFDCILNHFELVNFH